MQNTSHILEVAVEAGILIAGFLYLVYWMYGRKLKNGQVLFLFAIGFAGSLLLNLLIPTVPTYVFLLACLTPSLFSRLLGLLRRRRS